MNDLYNQSISSPCITSFLSNKDIALKPLDFIEESFNTICDNNLCCPKTSCMLKMFNQQDHLNLTFLSSAFDSLVNSHEDINIENISQKH